MEIHNKLEIIIKEKCGNGTSTKEKCISSASNNDKCISNASSNDKCGSVASSNDKCGSVANNSEKCSGSASNIKKCGSEAIGNGKCGIGASSNNKCGSSAINNEKCISSVSGNDKCISGASSNDKCNGCANNIKNCGSGAINNEKCGSVASSNDKCISSASGNKSGEACVSKRVYYNKMCAGAIGAIQSLSAYNNYFAFGGGTLDTVGSEVALQNFLFSVPSTIEEYNFNASLGDIFVTKSYNFGDSLHEEMQFSEVGIAISGEENATIIDRFVTKNDLGEVEPIVIKKDAEVIVKITLYLKLDSTNTNVKFFNVQSPLFARLLGVNILEGNPEPELKASVCYVGGDTKSVDLPEFSISANAITISPTISVAGGVIKFEGQFTINNQVLRGLVFYFCGVSCFYINCYDFAETTAKTLQNGELDKDRSLILTDKYIKNIEKIIIDSAGLETKVWYQTPYSLELGEINLKPFGDYEYNNCNNFLYNTSGSMLMYITDGRIDIYYRKDAVFKRVDTSLIPTKNFLKAKFLDEYLFIRYFDPESNKYSFLGFMLDPDALKMVDFGFVDTILPTLDWVDWDMAVCYSTYYPHTLIAQLQDKCHIYTMGRDEDGKYVLSDDWAYDYQFTNVFAQHKSELCDAKYYGFTTNEKGEKVTYYIKNSTDVEQKPTIKVIQYILFTRTADMYYVNANSYTLGVDNSKQFYDSVRLYLSSIGAERNANFSAGTGCIRAFFSQDGRYIAKVMNTGKVEFYFTKFDRMQQTKFVNSYTIPAGRTIKRIDIVGRVALIFFNETDAKVVAIPFICDYMYIENIPSGLEYTVYYNVSDLPGSSGQSVNCKNQMLVNV